MNSWWLSRATVALGALLAVGCGDATGKFSGHSSEESRYRGIAEGTEAPEDSGVFFVELERNGQRSICSASLITEDLLLTAAHCVTGQTGPVDCDGARIEAPAAPEDFRVSNVANLQGAPDPTWRFFAVQELHVLGQSGLLCDHDLALIQLTESVPSQIATPLEVQTTPPTAGDDYHAVGYGAVHSSGTGEGVRRSTSRKSVVCSGATCEQRVLEGLAGSAAQIPPRVSEQQFLGDGAGCPGDSGGPALSAGDSAPLILGVLSRGSNSCTHNVYTSLASVELRSLVRELSEASGHEPPEWTNEPIAPPPSEGGAPPSVPDAGGTPSAPTDAIGGQAGSTAVPEPPMDRDSEPGGCNCRLGAKPQASEGDFSAWPKRAALLLIPFVLWRRRLGSSPHPSKTLS